MAGSLNGTAFLVRLRTDGTVDPSFGPPTPTTIAVANVARPADLQSIERLATDSSGRLLAIVQQPSADTKLRVVRIAQECELFVGCLITPVVGQNLATIQVGLTANAPVGILVFRVVGSRTVRVGRVPFGPRHRGRRVVRWNLKVNGRRLAPGRYEIVMRAFDRSGKRVIDLSRPARFTIRAPR